jgi:hypothetical protein
MEPFTELNPRYLSYPTGAAVVWQTAGEEFFVGQEERGNEGYWIRSI